MYFVAGVVANSTDSSETVINFTIRSNVSNSTMKVFITPEDNSAFNVILSFKELHSCSIGENSSLPGPEMFSGKIVQQL